MLTCPTRSGRLRGAYNFSGGKGYSRPQPYPIGANFAGSERPRPRPSPLPSPDHPILLPGRGDPAGAFLLFSFVLVVLAVLTGCSPSSPGVGCWEGAGEEGRGDEGLGRGGGGGRGRGGRGVLGGGVKLAPGPVACDNAAVLLSNLRGEGRRWTTIT